MYRSGRKCIDLVVNVKIWPYMSRSTRKYQDLPMDVKISPWMSRSRHLRWFVVNFFSWYLLWLVMLIEICVGWMDFLMFNRVCVGAMDGFFLFIFCCIILCLVAGCLCCFWCEIFGWVYRIIWLCKPDQPNRIHPTNPITRTVLADWHFGWLMDIISLNPTWSGRVKYYPQTRPTRPEPTPKY